MQADSRSLPGDPRPASAPAAGYVRLAAASLAGGTIAATLRLADPFEHGVWLVAYLLLVGSLAPLLLGLGEAAVREHATDDDRRTSLQIWLWAAGTVTVPLGVLGASRLLVLAGSAALMMSLGSMALTLRDDAAGARRTTLAGYEALLLFMACSVCVGLALAWDQPWI